ELLGVEIDLGVEQLLRAIDELLRDLLVEHRLPVGILIRGRRRSRSRRLRRWWWRDRLIRGRGLCRRDGGQQQHREGRTRPHGYGVTTSAGWAPAGREEAACPGVVAAGRCPAWAYLSNVFYRST